MPWKIMKYILLISSIACALIAGFIFGYQKGAKNQYHLSALSQAALYAEAIDLSKNGSDADYYNYLNGQIVLEIVDFKIGLNEGAVKYASYFPIHYPYLLNAEKFLEDLKRIEVKNSELFNVTTREKIEELEKEIIAVKE